MRARRKALKLTQEAAADRAQMDMSYWGKIERGRIDPGLRLVARIAIALETTPATLLGEAVPPFEEEIVITLTRSCGGKVSVDAAAVMPPCAE